MQKEIKTSTYFKRFQTKLRRRREGKTDYFARRRLVIQAKNKYNTPKYRLVVRITNSDIIAQIVSAQIQGDVILTAAYSHELPRYGVKHGLTNWAAAYATGLLVARRALQKLGLDDKYVGVEEPAGEMSITEPIEGEPRPFKVILDVGLHRTSTGARIFGVLKGASDGGLHIPHSQKRYPGYDVETKSLDPEVLRKYIYGGHVAEFMEELEEEDDERFKKQFASYLADGIGSEDMEEIYSTAHQNIREDPSSKPTPKKPVEEYKAMTRKHRSPKLSYAQKKQRIQEKIAMLKQDMNMEG